MLLIEFDSNKPFALQGKYYLSKDIASTDLTARLQLLTIHFPKLRILWSPSPHATAELFEELKKGREQPDPAKAAAISIDVIDEYNKDRFNPIIHDFIKKMPGVTSKNLYAILNRMNSMGELLSASVEELTEIMGSGNAEMLYESLHKVVQPRSTPAEAISGQTARPKKGRFKSKAVGGKIEIRDWNKRCIHAVISLNNFKCNFFLFLS